MLNEKFHHAFVVKKYHEILLKINLLYFLGILIDSLHNLNLYSD